MENHTKNCKKLIFFIESGNDVLLVEGLSKSYTSTPLFSDITIDIKKGERVALVGNNGTGKTTLIKCLNGLHDIDSDLVFPSTSGDVISLSYINLTIASIVKAVNKAMSIGKKPEAPAAPTTKKCMYCKSEIAIDATRCPHCTSVLEEKA